MAPLAYFCRSLFDKSEGLLCKYEPQTNLVERWCFLFDNTMEENYLQ